MQLGNSTGSWGFVARVLHWAVAAMVVGQVATGWLSEAETDREASFALIRDHFQFGIILSGLILMRLLWRLTHRPPSPPPDQPRGRAAAAEWVHRLLYTLLLILPVSGYIVWVHMDAPMDVFGLFVVPALFNPPVEDETLRAGSWYVHYFAGWALISLVLLHILAAFWHQFVLRDGRIRRMIG